MHPRVYREFRDILAGLAVEGRVLEIGAVPRPDSLLTLPSLRACERVGVNMDIAAHFDGFDVLKMNGNDLSAFPDGHFDCVISNATLEHDKFFWKTCAEVRRVLKTGGAAVIGVPGFTAQADRMERGVPPLWRLVPNATLTFRYHGAPLDYYRFSDTAVREVLLSDYRDVQVRSIMLPPRLIGTGYKI